MKYKLLYISAFLFLACTGKDKVFPPAEENSSTTETIDSLEVSNPIFSMHQDIDTFFLGDLNSDELDDTVIVISPVHAYPDPDDLSGGGCEDDSCLTTVQFSFCESILYHSGALGFQTIFAVEDLNSDGISEIGFIPNWFQSCWQGLFVYSLQNSNWVKIGKGSVFACTDEDFSKRVKKRKANEFEIISVTWTKDGGEMIDTTEVFFLH